MKLENQIAVVYAGARGIGKAYCDILLQKGCKVRFLNNLILLKTSEPLIVKCWDSYTIVVHSNVQH